MAYQRVTRAQFRTKLLDQLGSDGTFWITAEINAAINEAVSIWQALTGDIVATVTQSITNTTENLVDVVTDHTAGKVLSVIRVAEVGGSPLQEVSYPEMDSGWYGWRTETASVTTQRPAYWSPVGLSKFFIYPRTGATSTYSLLVYSDSTPLSSDASYLDVDEGSLQKLVGMAQALLAFKEGMKEGDENADALKQLFMEAAEKRNQELKHTALYKNFMGHSDDTSEPAEPTPQTGVRG